MYTLVLFVDLLLLQLQALVLSKRVCLFIINVTESWFGREDALPADELSESERQSSQADLAICLGTSLQITPACNIPLRTVKAGRSSPEAFQRHLSSHDDEYIMDV